MIYAGVLAAASSGPPAEFFIEDAALTTTSNTLTDFTTNGSIDMEMKSGVDYLVVLTCDVAAAGSSATAGIDVTIAGTSLFTSVKPTCEFRNSSDNNTISAIAVYSSASAATREIKIRGRSSGSISMTFTNGHVTLIPLGADDYHTTTHALQTTTSKTAVNAASLNFTPASTGDYIIIASFVPYLVNSSNVYQRYQLTDGTSNIQDDVNIRCEATNNYDDPRIVIGQISGASGSTDAELDMLLWGSGSTTMGAAEITIVALRKDRFDDCQYLDAAYRGATDTAWTTVDTLTFTPNAAQYLTLACGGKQADSNNTGYIRFTDDGVTIADSNKPGNFEPSPYAYRSFAAHHVPTYAAASRDLDIDSYANTGFSRTAGAAILSIDLTGIW